MENATWSIIYAFTEDEYFRPDHVSASFGVSMAPGQTIFWHDIVIVKYFLLSEDENDTVDNARVVERLGSAVGKDTRIDRQKGTWMGQYTLVKGNVKRQVGTQSEMIMESKDEAERIRAIRDIFGIDIDDGAAKYIEGRAAALTEG